jgi:hypothetical protein
MKRHLVVAFAALLVVPRLAAAQASDPGWGPKLRITPFVGISPSFTQAGEAIVLTDAGFRTHDYDLDFASGFGLGIAAEYRLWNRFAVIASGMWSSRGDSELFDFEDELIYEVDGTNLWMAKAALAVRLREVDPDLQLRRLNASVFAGPAIIYDSPKEEAFTPPEAAESNIHFALNMGAEAEMPFSNNKMAFVLGLEDNMIFWDNDNTVGRVASAIRLQHPGAAIAVETNRSHLWVFRMGLAWRFM